LSANEISFSRKEIKQFHPVCLIAPWYFNVVCVFPSFKANINMTFSNVEQVNVAIGDNASVIANPGELILLL